MYESHARRYAPCGDPLWSPGLCDRGIPLAPMVVDYLYGHSGNYFANHAHEGDMTSRLYLSASARPVCRLLHATELGLIPNLTTPRAPPGAQPDLRHRPVEIVERRPQRLEPDQSTEIYPFFRRVLIARETRAPRAQLPRATTRGYRIKISCRLNGSTVDIELRVPWSRT